MPDPSTHRPKRVLVVDDHAPLTHLWKVLLENTGDYLVQVENHSREALAAARRFRPDVLILDMQMPGMDGGEVAACIRADRQLRHTPMVFMTSLVAQQEADAGKRIAGCPCLPKPTSRQEMLRIIRLSLAEARLSSGLLDASHSHNRNTGQRLKPLLMEPV